MEVYDDLLDLTLIQKFGIVLGISLTTNNTNAVNIRIIAAYLTSMAPSANVYRQDNKIRFQAQYQSFE